MVTRSADFQGPIGATGEEDANNRKGMQAGYGARINVVARPDTEKRGGDKNRRLMDFNIFGSFGYGQVGSQPQAGESVVILSL